MMSAKRARLARWIEGHGIEIGALHRPLEVPPEASVTYVDHLPEAELREHYPELAGQPLAEVSVIGSAEDLSAFDDSSLDFVIANHLLEHLEYPVRGLLEFQRVLRPGGLLYLALPDKRATFDRKRALTTVDHLLDEYREEAAERNRWDHYLDWATNVDGKASGPEAEAHARDLMARHYSIHFHVWRPDTFLEFFFAARVKAGVTLEVLQFAAPEFERDDEFILLLAKASTADLPRLPPEPVRAQAQLAAVSQSSPDHASDASNGMGGQRGLRRTTVRRRLAGSAIGPPIRTILRALRRA